MKKHNWIIDPLEINATPTPWGQANGIKFDVISLEEHKPELINGYKPVRAAKLVKYIASMTEEDAAAFKLSTDEMTIKKAKW